MTAPQKRPPVFSTKFLLLVFLVDTIGAALIFLGLVTGQYAWLYIGVTLTALTALLFIGAYFNQRSGRAP